MRESLRRIVIPRRGSEAILFSKNVPTRETRHHAITIRRHRLAAVRRVRCSLADVRRACVDVAGVRGDAACETEGTWGRRMTL